MSFQFKLSKPAGLTRRVGYPSQPSWDTLAARIQELFHIPAESVGVSYVDADGDEVTLSSETELQEFYLASGERTVKFTVVDLSRNDEKSLPETPRTGLRNTFGDIDTDDGWQRLSMPPLGGIFAPPRAESPHAFIQTVDSESDDQSTTDFGQFTSTLDKGKAKAVDASPAPSVVDDVASIRSRNEPVVFEATASRTATPVPEAPVVLETVEDPSDPPVPTLDVPTPASLPNDFAALLTTLTHVLSSHPELSEGLRNIVNNATNGAYWDSMSQAAAGAEEEAGRRVADALGGMLRTLSQALGPTPGAAESTTEDSEQPWRTSTPTTEPVNSTSFFYAPPLWGGMRGGRGRGGRPPWGAFHHHGPSRDGPPPPAGPPPPFMPPWANFGRAGPRGYAPPPGPPPPPGSPPPPGPPAPPPQTSPKPSPQELRAQVEAAKAAYKREKERYRTERLERRKARDSRVPAGASAATGPNIEATSTVEKPVPAAEAPEPVIVSNGNLKGGYPPLEMYSVPHRHNTYHGQPSRRRVPESASERALLRITKRLAAMGITENAHPALPAKIKEQLPEGNISDEAEQNIVSTLVEELLFMSPKPTASGSRQNADVPGAWL